MLIILTVVILLLSAGALLAGLYDPDARRRRLLAVAMLGIILLFWWVVRDKARELAIFDSVIYGHVQWTWLVVPFGYLLGAGLQVVSPGLRRAVYVGVYAFVIVLVSLSLSFALFLDYDDMSRAEIGDVRQSTGYSCGPAAATTLLHGLGVPVSEYAICCDTRPSIVRGTNEVVLAHAMDARLRDRGWSATAFASDDLPQELPCLIGVRLEGGSGHWLVLEAARGSGFIVFDPLAGRETRSGTELREAYLGFGIAVRQARH